MIRIIDPSPRCVYACYDCHYNTCLHLWILLRISSTKSNLINVRVCHHLLLLPSSPSTFLLAIYLRGFLSHLPHFFPLFSLISSLVFLLSFYFLLPYFPHFRQFPPSSVFVIPCHVTIFIWLPLSQLHSILSQPLIIQSLSPFTSSFPLSTQTPF